MSDIHTPTSGSRHPYPPQDDERIHVFVLLPDDSGYQVSFGRWYARADAETFKTAVENDGSGRRVFINPDGVFDNTVAWSADDRVASQLVAAL